MKTKFNLLCILLILFSFAHVEAQRDTKGLKKEIKDKAVKEARKEAKKYKK